jgi:peptidoglycan/LPS O-acetylase OafA/YrhL
MMSLSASVLARTLLPESAILRSPVFLSALAETRENNFTLLRLALAWLVLFGHSWQLAGARGVDPLSAVFAGRTWIGAVAVNGFFAVSGFLVTASVLRHGLLGFAAARLLRILPGLVVCVLVSTFALGPLFTNETLAGYFRDPTSWCYLANVVLWPELKWNLPGVFLGNPVTTVNAVFWSLPAEVSCYVWLAAVGLVGRLDDRARANLILLGLLLLGTFLYPSLPLFGNHPGWREPATYFLAGMFAWVNRSLVPLHGALALAALVAVTLVVAVSAPQPAFDAVFAVCLPYLLLYAAYCTPPVNLDRTVGDLSYGIYIYAYPIQQILFWPAQSPWTNAALATAAAAATAYVSWHGVEKPALGLRRYVESRGVARCGCPECSQPAS